MIARSHEAALDEQGREQLAADAPKIDNADHQQWERNKAHLDQAVAELVKAVATTGDTKIKAEDHRTDADNFSYAADHRRAEAGAKTALDRAVNAYVRLRRGPQPPAQTT